MVNISHNDPVKCNKCCCSEKSTFARISDFRSVVNAQNPSPGNPSFASYSPTNETSVTGNRANECHKNLSLHGQSERREDENFGQVPFVSNYSLLHSHGSLIPKLRQAETERADGSKLSKGILKEDVKTETNFNLKSCVEGCRADEGANVHRLDLFTTALQSQCASKNLKSSTSTFSPNEACISAASDLINLSTSDTFSSEHYSSVKTPQVEGECQQGGIGRLFQKCEERWKEIYKAADQCCVSLVLQSRVPYVEDTLTEPADDETEDDARHKLAVKKKFVEVVQKLQEDELPTQRRGNLPKESIAYLKKWFHEHASHPYPSDEEKCEMSRETNIGVAQISHWFINYRKRVWKPSLSSCPDQLYMGSEQPNKKVRRSDVH